MAWASIDNRFPNDPKLMAAGGLVAAQLHLAAICYANEHLTDGFIPEGQVVKLVDLSTIKWASGEPILIMELAHEMTKVLVPGRGPLWDQVEGGYMIHDYLEHQTPRAEVKEKSSSHRGRAGGRRRAETAARDGHGRMLPAGEPLDPADSSLVDSAGSPMDQQRPSKTPAKPSVGPATDQRAGVAGPSNRPAGTSPPTPTPTDKKDQEGVESVENLSREELTDLTNTIIKRYGKHGVMIMECEVRTQLGIGYKIGTILSVLRHMTEAKDIHSPVPYFRGAVAKQGSRDAARVEEHKSQEFKTVGNDDWLKRLALTAEKRGESGEGQG